MDTKINFSLKKLSPMRYKKKHNKIQNFFIKINDDDTDWYNLKDLYDTIEYGNKKNPITHTIIRSSENQPIKIQGFVREIGGQFNVFEIPYR